MLWIDVSLAVSGPTGDVVLYGNERYKIMKAVEERWIASSGTYIYGILDKIKLLEECGRAGFHVLF